MFAMLIWRTMGLWLVHTVVFTVHANLLLGVSDSDQEILDILYQKLLLHVPFKINNTHIKLTLCMHLLVNSQHIRVAMLQTVGLLIKLILFFSANYF